MEGSALVRDTVLFSTYLDKSKYSGEVKGISCFEVSERGRRGWGPVVWTLAGETRGPLVRVEGLGLLNFRS